MFDYQDLSTTTFNGGRWYQTPGSKFYPSITTILGGSMPVEKEKALTGWRNSLGAEKADRITKAAADRGTAVHLMIERHLKGEDVFAHVNGKSFAPEDVNSFTALKGKLKNIEKVWCQEAALYSDTLEIAGRVDCIGIYKGKPCIIDFKTSTRVKADKDIEDYKLQLTAYAAMHNEMFDTNIDHGVILMVADVGFPLEFNVELNKYFDALCLRIDQFYEKVEKTALH